MIKKYSLIALQTAVNYALSLDDAAHEKMSVLTGRVLEIIVQPVNMHFFIEFMEGSVRMMSDYAGTADTTIESSPWGWMRLSVSPASQLRALFHEHIRMSGDLECGQRIQKFFDELDLDWEGELAHVTGDAVAYKIGSMLRQGMETTKQGIDSLSDNMTSFVQEEWRIFPPQEELHDFLQDVDELSVRAERLIAHVNQWMARHEIH